MTSSPTARGRTIAITGASGLIGRHLADHFRRREWNVRALVRDPSRSPFAERDIEVLRAELPDAIDERAFEGADVVIHAAYATAESRADTARRVNEVGTARVLAASRAAGVHRFVFVSSFAAHPDARSYYGRSKLALERQLDSVRDLVIRPGLVLAPSGGLFERMRRSIESSPVVPLVGGGRQILQTVHIDDLCVAFERAVQLDLTGALNVAEPEGVKMRAFIEMMAARLNRRARLVPIPAQSMLVVVRALERLRLPLPVSSENVLGLLAMRHTPTARDLARLGIRVRTTGESLEELI
ncbi:MAG: NAD-dependent epimerase/dehydratase family protein [Pseudomonadota bacterium]|nr:NAD-dependent epimerase/dehydratase family protein [Pseudomonadota bacterium]